MTFASFVLVLAVLFVVVLVVSSPLRVARAAESSVPGELADLEAAREAKYREIRDAELDHSTGKLSDADFGALDGALRAEAIEILKALDRARDRLDAEADAVAAPLPDVTVAATMTGECPPSSTSSRSASPSS